MTNAFATGLSGLRANSTGVETVGHNLANLNTTGFKASTVSFRELLGVSGQPGLGTAEPVITRLFTQGHIQQSNGALDSAISGDGFFVLKGADGQQLFSRAGSFQIDSEGRLISPGGAVLQGWLNNGTNIDANGPVTDLVIPPDTVVPAKATSEMSVSVNLDATAEIDETFTTGVQVFDSLGESHTVTLSFTKTGPNAWSYSATMPAADFGQTGDAQQLGGGDLSFDSSGRLTSPAAGAGVIQLSASGLTSGAADLQIGWTLYGASGQPFIRQLATLSAASSIEQNGSPAAEVLSISMGEGGRVTAKLSNGQDLVMAQLALARLRNPGSLEPVGDNMYALGAMSGEAAIGQAQTGGRGRIVAKALEGSTVDVAQEFTNLIVYQRGYQANSRVITTADELAQDTLNIKR
jgi:flagellar hook protein FlgE